MIIVIIMIVEGPASGPSEGRPLPEGRPDASSTYTRSPLEDSRLFGPSPWKILAATYEKKDY